MKRRFKSYAECEAAYEAAQADATVLAQVLNAVTNDEPCGTFRKGGYTVRVYRPTAAHGGLVSVTFRTDGQAPYTTAAYLDTWANDRKLWLADPQNAEAVALNELRYKAVEYRNKATGFWAD